MTALQQPKVCRYCGAPILWGLKPGDRNKLDRPLDAMSGRPSYMVFGDTVYYGLAFDPHICKSQDIEAWDMKYERQHAPVKRQTKRPKPPVRIVTGKFEEHAKMYLDCLREAQYEDMLALAYQGSDHYRDLHDFRPKLAYIAYRQRRNADHWMHALKVNCPRCGKLKGKLCTSIAPHLLGHDVQLKNPHQARVTLADKKFGKPLDTRQ